MLSEQCSETVVLVSKVGRKHYYMPIEMKVREHGGRHVAIGARKTSELPICPLYSGRSVEIEIGPHWINGAILISIDLIP
jgi:hypothetical protein